VHVALVQEFAADGLAGAAGRVADRVAGPKGDGVHHRLDERARDVEYWPAPLSVSCSFFSSRPS
jgi:hypothetical protein